MSAVAGHPFQSLAAGKTRTRRLTIALAVLYLVGVHLLLAVLLWKTDAWPRINARLTGSVPTNPHVDRTLAYHRAMDASVPDGAVVFLGDSITQSLATAAVTPCAVNYGIGGATTVDLLHGLPSYRSLARASAIFLLIGTNDIGYGRSDGLDGRLEALAAGLPQRTPLIWSGVMPADFPDAGLAAIADANTAIRKICAAREGCTYIDSTALFAAGGRSLFSDRVHLNEAGYTTWISALRPAHAQAGTASACR